MVGLVEQGFSGRQFGRSGRRSFAGKQVIEPIGRGMKCEYLYIAYSYLPESIHYGGSTRQPSRQMTRPFDARQPVWSATPWLAHWFKNRIAIVTAMKGMHVPHIMSFLLLRPNVQSSSNRWVRFSPAWCQRTTNWDSDAASSLKDTSGGKLICPYWKQTYSGHKSAFLSIGPQTALLSEGLRASLSLTWNLCNITSDQETHFTAIKVH